MNVRVTAYPPPGDTFARGAFDDRVGKVVCVQGVCGELTRAEVSRDGSSAALHLRLAGTEAAAGDLPVPVDPHPLGPPRHAPFGEPQPGAGGLHRGHLWDCPECLVAAPWAAGLRRGCRYCRPEVVDKPRLRVVGSPQSSEDPDDGTETENVTQTTERPEAVVTNVSDLSRSMRDALLSAREEEEEEAGTFVLHSATSARTAAALCRRGLADVSDALTEAGLRARAALLELEAGRAAAALSRPRLPLSDTYQALRHAAPALTDVARYVAQLRRWSRQGGDEAGAAGWEWEEGRRDAFAMVADQLEEHVLRELAPMLMPEAVRVDAETAAREVR